MTEVLNNPTIYIYDDAEDRFKKLIPASAHPLYKESTIRTMRSLKILKGKWCKLGRKYFYIENT